MLRAKAMMDRVNIDTSEDILTLVFKRSMNGPTTVTVLRNGKPTDISFTCDKPKDPGYGSARAQFEGLVAVDRRHSCPKCGAHIR